MYDRWWDTNRRWDRRGGWGWWWWGSSLLCLTFVQFSCHPPLQPFCNHRWSEFGYLWKVPPEHTYLGTEHTHTHTRTYLRHWVILINGSKWTVAVTVTIRHTAAPHVAFPVMSATPSPHRPSSSCDLSTSQTQASFQTRCPWTQIGVICSPCLTTSSIR